MEPPWPRTTGDAEMESAAARDWAELPRDALTTILGKLGCMAEMLMRISQVCRSWRRASADEAALWSRIMAGTPAGLAFARLALRWSVDRCGEAFRADCVADDSLLFHLAEKLPSLKSLHLISCYNISNEGFVEAIQKFPLLEKLEISLCKNIFGEAIEIVGKACPHLKHFRLSNDRFYCCFQDEYSNNQEARGISTMSELRSLQLFGNNLTNKGLTAILDSCPHLEFLDIRHCFNVHMDAAPQAKCSRIKTLRLADDSTDDYEFQVKSPIRYGSDFNFYVEKEHVDFSRFGDFEDEDLSPYDNTFQIEDEDLLEPDDEPLEEPVQIPPDDDEESMMLDYYARLYENDWDEDVLKEDDGAI